MVKRFVTLILSYAMAMLLVHGGEAYYPTAMVGLSGEELLKALKVAIRSHDNVMSQFDEKTWWNICSAIDRHNDGSVWDMFSPDVIMITSDGEVPDGMSFCHVAYPEWAGDKEPYDEDLSLDLHNVYPCQSEVAGLKRGLIPWSIDNVTFDNESVAIGNVSVDGTTVTAYEPCDEYKGDIARVLMYVAVCYGGEFLWCGQSWNLFLDNYYPVFNKRSTELMLEWHKLDPVSSKEIERNEAVYKLQGNRNPFVDYPKLAEHIWGELINEPFSFEGGSGESGDYLRASYMLGDTIWLRSSHVPSGAVWSIDGKSVADICIPASELGTGLHELRFSVGEMNGKMIIEIK